MAQIQNGRGGPLQPPNERRKRMEKKLTIQLSPEDMALLKAHAAWTRMSQSAYVRKLIRGYVPKAYPPEAFYDLMKRLDKGSGALNGEVLKGLLALQEAVTSPEEIEDG